MAPMLGWYPGCLAYRQRVKRFRQFRAAVRSSAVGRDRWLDRSWFRSAQNRLTRVPLGQGRAAAGSSALGVTGGWIQRAVTSTSTAPALSVYRGTLAWRQRVKRFRQARAVVRSSAWGVNGGLVQRAITSNSTAPTLSVYPGTLACRQRVKRSPAVQPNDPPQSNQTIPRSPTKRSNLLDKQTAWRRTRKQRDCGPNLSERDKLAHDQNNTAGEVDRTRKIS